MKSRIRKMENGKQNKNGKMTIEKLARMTQDEFSRMSESIDARFDRVEDTLHELKEGQKRILEVALEIPSKKAFERLENKVEGIDLRLTSVERKVK